MSIMSLLKTAFIQNLPETPQFTCFMMFLMSVAHSVSFRPVRHKSNYVPNESLQIAFCQKLLATDQTR